MYITYNIFRNRIKNYVPCILFGMVIVLTGCVTRNDAFVPIDELVQQQQYTSARIALEKNKDKIYDSKKDEILYLLDDGALALHGQDDEGAIIQLDKAERLMQEARTTSVTEQVSSFLVNNNTITYAGTDYELILTNIMKSLAYLSLDNFDDGFVEVRRTQDRITKLQTDHQIRIEGYNNIDNAYIKAANTRQVPFADSAFARLLSMWLYRADGDISNAEVAIRKYNNAIAAQPAIYDFIPPALTENTIHAISYNTPSIQIVAMTGRVPFRYEKGFSLNTVENGIVIAAFDESTHLDRDNIKLDTRSSSLVTGGVLSVPGVRPGLNLKFSLPYLARVHTKTNRIKVLRNDTVIGTLDITERIDTIATALFNTARDFIYAKNISRVIGKAIIGAVGTAIANQSDTLLGDFVNLISGAFITLSEKADLRGARYFPAIIWTGDFSLPSTGDYVITLQYFNEDTLLYTDSHIINAKAGLSTINLLTFSYLE